MPLQTIQKLNPRHHKILELCLRGWTNKQIAENLCMSAQQVSIVRNSPSFDVELAERRAKLDGMVDEQIIAGDEEITAEIKKGAKDAVAKLCGHINSVDPSVSLRASCEVLDRAGHPRVQRIESKSVSVVITAENAKLIEDTMQMDRR